jgi:tetratricopeptide (TPR) repeat protein/predicted aspartyl protease
MICRLTACALSALALAVAGAPARAADCQMAKIADLPVTMAGTQPLVTAKINGKDGLFLIDTGSFYSVLAQGAVEAYGLKTYPAPSTFAIVGISGARSSATITKVGEFIYAGIPIRQISFLVVGGGYGPGVVGVIGQNLLGAVDVEYDLANGVIRLFQAKDCGSEVNLAYWSAGKALSILPTGQQTARAPHIIVDAKVNSYSIKAMLDTGASTSILQRTAARRAGVDMSDANLKTAGFSTGFGGGAVETWIGGVASFSIGDEQIKNTRLRMGNVDLSGAEMLVGADFFLSHRVMVARSQHRLYFTYNGGPVFRLDQPLKIAEGASAPSTPGPAAATEAGTSAGSPASADELARRGAASAARNDVKSALADISRAIEMEPKNWDFRLQRARVRLKAEDKAGASRDLDEAVKLKPDEQLVRLTRASVRLQLKDLTGAEEDYLAAIKLPPQDKSLPLSAAILLARGHATDAAVRLLDGWIETHQKDDLLPAALDDRCWTRALAGVELEKALKDCDESIRRSRRGASQLDSRGLVFLRMGRYDDAIGQYNQVIFQAPRAAWALYGRGVAKAKKGLPGAKADLDAATAADKDAVELAKSFGIVADEAAAKS